MAERGEIDRKAPDAKVFLGAALAERWLSPSRPVDKRKLFNLKGFIAFDITTWNNWAG
jgi:hypothetical protein